MMKKLLAIFLSTLLVLTMLIVIVGCKGDEKNDEKPAIVQTQNQRYVSNPVSKVNLEVAFTDTEYNYFYFYLGNVEMCPIIYEETVIYDGMIDRTLSYTVKQANEQMVSVSNSSIVSNSVSHGGSVSVKGKFGTANNNVTIGLEYNNNFTDAKSTTSSQSNTTKWVQEHQKTETFTINRDCNKGYYRYTLFATCDVYAVVVYNLSRKTFEYDYLICPKYDSYKYGIDYSENGSFESDDYKTKLYFDLSVIDNIDLDESLPIGKNVSVNSKPMMVAMQRYSCLDNVSYNKDKPETNSNWKSRHTGFELGHLELFGCVQTGNLYKIVDAKDLRLYYRIDEDLKDLPKNGAVEHFISNDTASSVKDTNIQKTIGKGAYYIKISYADYSSAEYNATDVFNGKLRDGYVDLLQKADLSKAIAKIDVVVVYELHTRGPGFLGIYWDETPNWRCEYTFNFVG